MRLNGYRDVSAGHAREDVMRIGSQAGPDQGQRRPRSSPCPRHHTGWFARQLVGEADTILSQLGFTDCPSTLAQLIAVGVSEKARFAKRRRTREEAKRRAREICTAINPTWAKVQERGLPDSRYKLCNSTGLPDDTQI